MFDHKLTEHLLCNDFRSAICRRQRWRHHVVVHEDAAGAAAAAVVATATAKAAATDTYSASRIATATAATWSVWDAASGSGDHATLTGGDAAQSRGNLISKSVDLKTMRTALYEGENKG